MLRKRVDPQILFLEGRNSKDGLVYSWWDKDLPTRDAFEKWIIDKEYLNSPLIFKAPPAITTEFEYSLLKYKKFLRHHLGWGFENILKGNPTLMSLFSPFVNHDGTDTLHLKHDRIVYIVLFIVLLLVLIVFYILMKWYCKVLRWCCRYE